ncbi:MAG TPA: PEP-CTERM sorting domain-containing protein [Vicinamibacterales bacterium]|nr:PEP-CTERM sorting domain-containing protein [Vicinamibacterales bacterium]
MVRVDLSLCSPRSLGAFSTTAPVIILHGRASMRIGVLLVVALLVSASARAASITWIDSGSVTFVSDRANLPGLTIGTPWALEITFDPDAPGNRLPGSVPGGECYTYSTQSTTFTLGGFTYSRGPGKIWTNSNLPGQGCSSAQTGRIQFEFVGGWIQEAGAWNLNQFIFLPYYTDVVRDGSLPRTPTPVGSVDALDFWGGFADGRPFIAFQDAQFTPALLDDQPAPVPEPATIAMMGVGLAWGIGRSQRRRKKSEHPLSVPAPLAASRRRLACSSARVQGNANRYSCN